jgi:hypothetical protein
VVADCSLAPARKSRQIAADVIDGLVCGLIFSVGIAIYFLTPSLSRSVPPPEQITRFLLWPMIATLLCLWYARTELGGGTLGQIVARVQRVRLDGTPVRAVDWWRRHWPSSVFIVYGVVLIATSIIASVNIKQDRAYVEWMRFWGTIISLAAAAVLIASYSFTRTTQKTLLIEKPHLYTGHGFEVLPGD